MGRPGRGAGPASESWISHASVPRLPHANFTFPHVGPEDRFDRVVTLAQAAEAPGFDAVTVTDHFYQIGGVGPPDKPGWGHVDPALARRGKG